MIGLGLDGYEPDSGHESAIAFRIRVVEAEQFIPAHSHRKGQLILALHGAQLIVALGVPWALSYDAMLAQMKAYACQNGVYVAYVNRAGEEADFVFGGGSALIDPEGYVTAQAAGAPQSLYGRIHPERSHQVRTRLPFLDNRKCQGYLPLIQNLVREA